MAPIAPDRVPAHFPAGTTVRYSRSLDNFSPEDGWLYTIYLNGLTTKFNKQANAGGGADFQIEFLPSDTEGLAPGPYRYTERLTNPGTALTLTQVVTAGAEAIYSFSGFTGPQPYVGINLAIAGYTNSTNNLAAGAVTAIELDGVGAGTVTVANAAAVNETAAATGRGPALTYDLRGDELVINIEPDAATSPAGTFQTYEERTLAVVEAAISGNLSGGIQSYQIAGRAVSKYNLKELTDLRGLLRAAVWRQQNPGRLSQSYHIEFNVQEETKFPATWTDVTGLDR
jgi:hypothetical protein